MGLVLLSADYLRDDVISKSDLRDHERWSSRDLSRFLCIRKWFRNSVFYFDATRSVALIAEKIHSHYEFCRNNPGTVQGMASRARAVFEQQFSAERMLRTLPPTISKSSSAVRSGFPSRPNPQIS